MVQSAAQGQARVTASELLKRYHEKEYWTEDDDDEDLFYRKLFAARTAHLPGNNWCQDWIMWFRNNHPLLALCCRDRRNPVGLWPRLVILLSSISFGIITTNIIYLYFRSHPRSNLILMRIEFGEEDQNGDKPYYDVTCESIAVWTIGGLIHTLFDLGIWHLNGCACCVNSVFAKIGKFVSIAISAMLLAIASIVIVWRASYEDNLQNVNDETMGNTGGDNDWMNIERPSSLNSFQFLWTYVIELFSVW